MGQDEVKPPEEELKGKMQEVAVLFLLREERSLSLKDYRLGEGRDETIL
jgi:hypothetical protein